MKDRLTVHRCVFLTVRKSVVMTGNNPAALDERNAGADDVIFRQRRIEHAYQSVPLGWQPPLFGPSLRSDDRKKYGDCCHMCNSARVPA
jgi:hypothetical protein